MSDFFERETMEVTQVLRRSFSNGFKLQVAMEYLQTPLILQTIADKYQIDRPSTINKWTKSPNVFDTDGKPLDLELSQKRTKTTHALNKSQ
jgi:transposase-like protein